jgi:hypothetical protein
MSKETKPMVKSVYGQNVKRDKRSMGKHQMVKNVEKPKSQMENNDERTSEQR